MYTVVTMPRALRQLESICAWWAAHRPATDVIDRSLGRVIDQLAAFPYSGQAVRVGETKLRRVPILETPYVIIYRVRPRLRRIEIIACLHDGREP